MKKLRATKVFAGEKRLKDVYPYATKWEVIKFRAMRLFKQILIGTAMVGILVGVLIGAYQTGAKTVQPITMYAEKKVDVSDMALAEKIDSLKNGVVEKIRKCESAGYKETDGVIVFDTNNKASIGTMQFQVNTVIYYTKKLYGKDITRKEAVLIALDDKLAGDLARDIMFKTSSMAQKDWTNCARKLNSDAEIKIIKSLEE